MFGQDSIPEPGCPGGKVHTGVSVPGAADDACYHPRPSEDRIHPLPTVEGRCQDILDSLQILLDMAESGGAYGQRLPNPELVACWEYLDCTTTECPCHGAPAQRCWQVAGTHCGGKVQGTFASKRGHCEECPVYQHAAATPELRVQEIFHNLLHMVELREERLQEQSSQFHLVTEEWQETTGRFLDRIHELLAGVLAAARESVASRVPIGEGRLLASLHDLEALVRGTREFTRPNPEVEVPGVAQCTPDAVNIVDLLEALLGERGAHARAKDLLLLLHVNPAAPRRVEYQRSTLARALGLLLDHALLKTAEGLVLVHLLPGGDDHLSLTVQSVRNGPEPHSPDAPDDPCAAAAARHLPIIRPEDLPPGSMEPAPDGFRIELPVPPGHSVPVADRLPGQLRVLVDTAHPALHDALHADLLCLGALPDNWRNLPRPDVLVCDVQRLPESPASPCVVVLRDSDALVHAERLRAAGAVHLFSPVTPARLQAALEQARGR